jgi:hypothetical protein
MSSNAAGAAKATQADDSFRVSHQNNLTATADGQVPSNRERDPRVQNSA